MADTGRARRPLTAASIARDRAAAMHLSVPARLSPARLVAWLGAVQSQDYLLGRWSIAQRLAGADTGVDAAIADGSILRTHVLRPTWHFVARDDLRWMQALTGPRVLAQMRHMDRRSGLDGPLVVRGMKAIAAAIERHGHITRREAGAALSRAGISANAWLVGHYLMHAEMNAVVCSGVPRGAQQTFALVDERAPRFHTMTRDEMLATLARRYFQSHGPATAKDYQWWSGLSGPDVARSLELLGRAVERVQSGERSYVRMVARRPARPAVRPRTASAQIIQPYDELVVAYSESRDVVDVSRAARGAGEGGAALLMRGVVYGGQLVARWRPALPRGRRGIAVEPLRRLSSAERAAVTLAAARFEQVYFASRGSH